MIAPIETIVLLILSVTTLALSVAWFIGVRRTQRILLLADAQWHALARLQGDIRALASGAAGIAQAVASTESQIKRVTDRQQNMEVREPTTQIYEHAVKLARNGSSAEELMSRCGLVREEAELLLRMHRFREVS